MEDGDLQAAWAQVLMHGFAEAGVTDVVISPGSRSTPLVLAAHHHPTLVCHDVIDERTAGFFALGQARITQRPTLLICTSGSAGAHYLPALVEARQAALPMLVLTADRPPELDRCGANQTIDQLKLFADHAVSFFDLGTAEGGALALRAVRRKAVQAVVTSRGPVPGGVHLNFRLRKPLEPAAEVAYPSPLAAHVLARPFTVYPPATAAPPAAAVAAAASWLAVAHRPLVVAGPAPVSQIAARAPVTRLLQVISAPFFVEATSQLRFRGSASDHAADSGEGTGAVHVDAFDTLLRTRIGPEMLPDLILQLGATPTSSAWPGYLVDAAAAGARHIVIAETGWHDAESTASALVQAGIAETVSALADRLIEGGAKAADQEAADHGATSRRAWIQDWLSADAAVWQTISARDGAENGGKNELILSEAEAVRQTARAVPARGLLAVGNSLPVRSLDTWVAGNAIDATVGVVHQRGASGIDGLVSGAAGAAIASGRPTVLLLGDVSLLHDLSGLAVVSSLAATIEVPLVVVVINNGGGRIFDQLPVAHHPQARGALNHWRTPHRTDFSHAAKTFGLPFERCRQASDLDRALARALARAGASVIEAVVSSGSAVDEAKALCRAVADGGGHD
jgi:2-succinyl-5-enolpyruvyl-6-hydroxy-3-cyclohexene-1-carboxylate synthase